MLLYYVVTLLLYYRAVGYDGENEYDWAKMCRSCGKGC